MNKTTIQQRHNTLRYINIILWSIISTFCLSSCIDNYKDGFSGTENARPGKTSVTRPDPGYMQYLERQSMLHQAEGMIEIISGSALGWKEPGSKPEAEAMLKQHSIWLHINPHQVLAPAHSNVFQQLASPIFWSSINKAGIKGLYIAPAGSSSSAWNYTVQKNVTGNMDTVQYEFSKTLGSDGDYSNIVQQAAKNSCMTGTELVPAATGIGPDFILAGMDFRNYQSIYCLVEVPKLLWANLPETAEGKTSALTAAELGVLYEQGIIPKYMQQDFMPYLPASGWAITGATRGADGNMKRWVYRYFIDKSRPVLNWDAPGATAKKIVSGNIIKQTGLLGNALTGFQMLPLAGLDSTTSAIATQNIPLDSTFAIVTDASAAISRQTRSYGGWSWGRDELPLTVLKQQLISGPDFMLDSVFSPAAEHALLTGNTKLLQFMAKEALALEIDFRRLVHCSPGAEGLSYLLPQLQSLAATLPENTSRDGRHAQAAMLYDKTINAAITILKKTDPQAASTLQHDKVLYTTPAAIAAIALGHDSGQTYSPESASEIRKGHALLLFFKAMQPGIIMLSGQDLTGSLPLNWSNLYDNTEKWDQRLAVLGAFPLLNNSEHITVSAQGVPKAKTLYAPLDVQNHDYTSFLHEVAQITKLREQLGLATGQLVGILSGKEEACIGLVTKLESEPSYVISICNFSRTKVKTVLSMEYIQNLTVNNKTQVKILYGAKESVKLKGINLNVNLAPWDKALIIITP